MEALILNNMAGESVQERFAKFYSFRFLRSIVFLAWFFALCMSMVCFDLPSYYEFYIGLIMCKFDEHNLTCDMRKAEEMKK